MHVPHHGQRVVQPLGLMDLPPYDARALEDDDAATLLGGGTATTSSFRQNDRQTNVFAHTTRVAQLLSRGGLGDAGSQARSRWPQPLPPVPQSPVPRESAVGASAKAAALVTSMAKSAEVYARRLENHAATRASGPVHLPTRGPNRKEVQAERRRQQQDGQLDTAPQAGP